MAIDIKVPTLGESVTEATLAKWFKKAGEAVAVDEPLCELETDKVTVEVSAPASGVLAELAVEEGATVAVGTVIGRLNEGAAAAKAPAPAKAAPAAAPAAPKAEAKAAPKPAPAASGPAMPPSPAAGKMMKEKGLAESDVAGSGRRGQVL